MTKSKPKISKVTNKADCGCSVGNYHESPEYYLTFCPLHASAEEMLSIISDLEYTLTNVWSPDYKKFHALFSDKCKQVLAKAQGKE